MARTIWFSNWNFQFSHVNGKYPRPDLRSSFSYYENNESSIVDVHWALVIVILAFYTLRHFARVVSWSVCVTSAFGSWLCCFMQLVQVWNRYPLQKSVQNDFHRASIKLSRLWIRTCALFVGLAHEAWRWILTSNLRLLRKSNHLLQALRFYL